MFELAAFYGVLVHGVILVGYLGGEVGPSIFQMFLGSEGFSNQCFARSGAGIDTVAAALAVHRGYCDAEVHTFCTQSRFSVYARSILFFFSHQYRTDGSVRAHNGALVALDTFIDLPFRNVDGYAAFFISSSAGGERTICLIHQFADGQVMAFLFVHGNHNFVNELVAGLRIQFFVSAVNPVSRNIDLHNGVNTFVNGSIVHVNHLLAFLAIGVNDGFLQVFHSIFNRDDTGQFEESGLHDHVDTTTQTDFGSNLHSVNGVEVDVVSSQVAFQLARQFLVQFFSGPRAVQQKSTAILQASSYIVAANVGGVMNSYVVSEVDQERHIDGGMTETQMGYGNTAGFLGVVGEVALSVHIGLVADDFDSALVGTYGTIGTQAPEHAGGGAFRGDIQNVFFRQGGVGYIVHNAYGEVVLGFSLLQVIKYSQGIARIEFLGTQTITAANDQRFNGFVVVNVTNIQVQRFAVGASFFGAVQNCNAFYSLRHSSQEVFSGERTIQVNVQNADLFALGNQQLGYFFSSLSAGAHHNNNVFSIGSTGIVEQFVVTASQFADLAHVLFNDSRQCFVILVYSFTSLEVDIRILCSAADNRVVRVQSMVTEFLQFIVVNQFLQIFVVQQFNLLDFVRGTETVKEVQERYMAFDGGQVSNSRHVHNFLYAAFSQQGKARLTASHNVTVIAENVQRAGGQSSGSYLEYSGQQFAGNFVHVGDHQQQTLGSGIGRGQSTCSQRTVHSTSSTSFRLHFHDFYRASEHVRFPMGSPFITHFCHRRRRSNGVDRCNITKSVRSIRGSGVTIHCLHFFHCYKPLFLRDNDYDSKTSIVPLVVNSITQILQKHK